MLGSACYAQAAVSSRVTNNVCCDFKNGWILVRFAKRKCNTADNGAKVVSAEVLQKHLKVLKRGDVKDVIRWCFAQWRDGLSNARDRGCVWRALARFAGDVQRLSRASSWATNVNSRARRVSENAKRDGRVRTMEKQGLCISGPIRQDNTTSIRRLSISYGIGQGNWKRRCAAARMIWTSVE